MDFSQHCVLSYYIHKIIERDSNQNIRADSFGIPSDMTQLKCWILHLRLRQMPILCLLFANTFVGKFCRTTNVRGASHVSSFLLPFILLTNLSFLSKPPGTQTPKQDQLGCCIKSGVSVLCHCVQLHRVAKILVHTLL